MPSLAWYSRPRSFALLDDSLEVLRLCLGLQDLAPCRSPNVAKQEILNTANNQWVEDLLFNRPQKMPQISFPSLRPQFSDRLLVQHFKMLGVTISSMLLLQGFSADWRSNYKDVISSSAVNSITAYTLNGAMVDTVATAKIPFKSIQSQTCLCLTQLTS